MGGGAPSLPFLFSEGGRENGAEILLPFFLPSLRSKLLFQEEAFMNTINSFVQAVAMDGRNIQNTVSSSAHPQEKITQNVQNILITPTGSEVAENIVQTAADVKADAQQLQKMSDMVMGRKLRFNVNEELGSIIVKIVDPNTDQVIKEIPSEDIQKLKINLRKAIGVIFDDMI